jgi:mannose-1-phosphate guanylyltransferase
VKDGSLFALADTSYWLDTGTPAAYLQAHWDLLEGRRPRPPAPGARRGDDDVWLIGSPSLQGTVTGASLVADGAVIAAGATVSRSVVGAGCRVDAGAAVSRSVLLPGARVATGSTVSGSAIGPGAVVGERSTLHPTSVIGAGAVVPAGSVVDGERVPA